MKPADLRRLSAAGLTTEQIAVVMEIMDEDAEARRAQGRARWRKHQEKKRNANVSQHEQTLAANSRERVTRVEDKTSTSEIEPQTKRESARAARLAPDWQLPVPWRQDAIDIGLPEHLIDGESANMRDWSLSSPAGAKRDWRAMWRNWCRKAVKDLPRARAGPPRKPNIKDFFAALGTENADRPEPSQAVVLRLPAATGR